MEALLSLMVFLYFFPLLFCWQELLMIRGINLTRGATRSVIEKHTLPHKYVKVRHDCLCPAYEGVSPSDKCQVKQNWKWSVGWFNGYDVLWKATTGVYLGNQIIECYLSQWQMLQVIIAGCITTYGRTVSGRVGLKMILRIIFFLNNKGCD